MLKRPVNEENRLTLHHETSVQTHHHIADRIADSPLWLSDILAVGPIQIPLPVRRITYKCLLADGGFRVNVRDFRSMILDYGLSEEEAFVRTMDWMYRKLA